MCVGVQGLDGGDDVLLIESNLVSEIVPFLEGDDGDRGRLEDRDLWLCHLTDDLDVTADGVLTNE